MQARESMVEKVEDPKGWQSWNVDKLEGLKTVDCEEERRDNLQYWLRKDVVAIGTGEIAWREGVVDEVDESVDNSVNDIGKQDVDGQDSVNDVSTIITLLVLIAWTVWVAVKHFDREAHQRQGQDFDGE